MRRIVKIRVRRKGNQIGCWVQGSGMVMYDMILCAGFIRHNTRIFRENMTVCCIDGGA